MKYNRTQILRMKQMCTDVLQIASFLKWDADCKDETDVRRLSSKIWSSVLQPWKGDKIIATGIARGNERQVMYQKPGMGDIIFVATDAQIFLCGEDHKCFANRHFQIRSNINRCNL